MLDWLKTILGVAYTEDIDSKDLFSDKNEFTAKLNNSKKSSCCIYPAKVVNFSLLR